MGQTWQLPNGSIWSFRSGSLGVESKTADICLSRAAPVLPDSSLTNVPQYLVSAATKDGISAVIVDLESRQIIFWTHSPCNSPVWPVRKPDGR